MCFNSAATVAAGSPSEAAAFLLKVNNSLQQLTSKLKNIIFDFDVLIKNKDVFQLLSQRGDLTY